MRDASTALLEEKKILWKKIINSLFWVETVQRMFRCEFFVTKPAGKGSQIPWCVWEPLNIIKSLPHIRVYFVDGICVVIAAAAVATIVCGIFSLLALQLKCFHCKFYQKHTPYIMYIFTTCLCKHVLFRHPLHTHTLTHISSQIFHSQTFLPHISMGVHTRTNKIRYVSMHTHIHMRMWILENNMSPFGWKVMRALSLSRVCVEMEFVCLMCQFTFCMCAAVPMWDVCA